MQLASSRSVRRRLQSRSVAGERWFRPALETLESRCLLSITPSVVLGRHVFYEHSRYDGNLAGANAADDSAIATDKAALLPGATAAFANVTSYSRGINGLMIDISGSHPNISADDFSFKVGNDNAPGGWSAAPGTVLITVRGAAGISGSDRVEIIWPDGAIKKQWLQVTVHANADTGLAQSDVFYFGNAVGDSGLGDTSTNALVGVTDELGARNNPQSTFNNIPLTNIFDFNRDGAVNATDALLARNNPTGLGNALRFIAAPTISPPALSAALENDTAPGGGTNSDGLTSDPTIAGTLTDTAPLASLTASLNGNPPVDIRSYLGPGAAFTLDAAAMEMLLGNALADGAYVLHLQATDTQGLTASAQVAFTLKLQVDEPSTPDLPAADDHGASNTDNVTNVSAPRVDIQAEAGTTVRLYVDNVLVNQVVGGPGLQLTLPALVDGQHQVKVSSEDAAGNLAESGVLTLRISTVAPVVTAATIASFTDDLTPHVTVTANAALPLDNGTQVVLDVDLNNDGDFADPGESGRTLSTLYNNKSWFELTPALNPTDLLTGPYLVQIRARVTDLAGNQGVSPLQSLKVDTLGSDALENYVHAADPSYTYSVARTVVGSGYTYYVLQMTSQTWRSSADVDKPVWQHWLELVVPTGAIGGTSLLYITGGSNSLGSPPSTPDSTMLSAALSTHTVTALLRQVPSEPLKFTDESFTRSEDAIIAYSFDKYVNHIGDPGNETWPVLVAMAKSAVKAMDTVQSFVPTVASGQHVNDFVVTGYSKRGWTTWLTAASDDRVRAIIPGVIDVLNMDEQMIHHYGYYGFFSPAIQDYQNENILQNIQMDPNQDLGRIVDPYKYLQNGRFDDMPKFVMNSSGDEFFVPDSSQYYFGDLPGTQNYLRYIPNTGHGLNSSAGTSTLSFYDAIINNRTLPQYSWTIGQDGSITVQTAVGAATSVKLWQATNPSARDFRNAYNPGIVWTSTLLVNQGGPGGAVYSANLPTPATGATAFFIELTFPSGLSGNPYVFTTQVSVKSNIAYAVWPFYTATNAAPSVVAAVLEDPSQSDAVLAQPAAAAIVDAVVSGLVFAVPPSDAAPAPTLRLAEPMPIAAVAAILDEAEQWGWGNLELPESDAELNAETIDLVLALDG